MKVRYEITNDVIREKMGLNDVGDVIEKSKWKCGGHMMSQEGR